MRWWRLKTTTKSSSRTSGFACLRWKPNDEEPIHHHRWPSVFVLDQVQGPVHDFAPDGTKRPPNRDVMQAIQSWNGQGSLVVNMAPQPLGRVFNASGKTIHGIRVEMKANR